MQAAAKKPIESLSSIIEEAIQKTLPARGFQCVRVVRPGELSVVLDGIGYQIQIEKIPGQY